MEPDTLAPKGLSAAWLKYFACVFMFIDHLSHVWDPFAALAEQSAADAFPLWGSAMYYLGRLAFPIFLFFLAEGCRRTHDMGRYLLRLGIFAAVSQLPFSLLFETWGGSVILTFFLGALGIFCFQTLCGRVSAPVAVLPALALAVLAELLRSDYGFIGVLLALSLYFCGESRKHRLVCLAIGLAICYLAYTPLNMLLLYWISPSDPFFTAFSQALPSYLELYLPYHLVVFSSSLLALLPLYFYSGRRGRGSKWFFYWFYPLHLLALWGLHFLIS